jgi:hypothetical protein
MEPHDEKDGTSYLSVYIIIIGKVSLPTRQHMDVHMLHCLPRGLPILQGERQALGTYSSTKVSEKCNTSTKLHQSELPMHGLHPEQWSKGLIPHPCGDLESGACSAEGLQDSDLAQQASSSHYI